ncbi:MAG: hypothetical protein KY054_00225 [Candidatus Nealsonbacteria bacterium]|nr:hypothetical protein [Candidatus Nealsonbacteria bacterium]
MTKKQRFILFLALLLTFLIIGPIAIFYSQGYRFDFQERKIVQTGGFYFRISPKSSEINISPANNKIIQKTTDFFFGTAFIKNLLPNRYNIEVKKNGYHSWRKSLEIREGFVTDIKNITLVPENPEFITLKSDVNNFFPLPEKNSLILKIGNNLNIYDIRTGQERTIFSANEDIEIIDFNFSQRWNKLILHTDKGYYLIDITQSIEPSLINVPQAAKNLIMHPQNDRKIIFLNENNIFFYDLVTLEIELILEEVITYNLWGDSIVWMSPDGFINIGIEEDYRQINRIPLVVDENNNYKIYFLGPEVMIRENETFYLLDNQEFVEVFESPFDPILSPDGGKILNYNNHEIRVLFLTEVIDQPQRNRGDNVFLTRFSGEINDIYWYTSHYLIFNIDSEIRIIEIDDRDHINLVNLDVIENSKIYFNFNDKKVYLLRGSDLLVSKRLIP